MTTPDKMTTEQLKPYAAEYLRRVTAGKSGRPKVLAPCPKCGAELGAAERRKHKCP